MEDNMPYDYSPLKLSGATTITQKKSGDMLKLLGADADILSLGDATHEGGDLKIYRNGSGDLQLSLDADAASNALALSVYGGVVIQNFLTLGTPTLSTYYVLSVAGSIGIGNHGYIWGATNSSDFGVDMPIHAPDTTNHEYRIRIDTNNIIVAKATGDGSGGIVDKAIGFYGVTPVVQAAHIADPAESIAANNAAIDAILVALENIGITASA